MLIKRLFSVRQSWNIHFHRDGLLIPHHSAVCLIYFPCLSNDHLTWYLDCFIEEEFTDLPDQTSSPPARGSPLLDKSGSDRLDHFLLDFGSSKDERSGRRCSASMFDQSLKDLSSPPTMPVLEGVHSYFDPTYQLFPRAISSPCGNMTHPLSYTGSITDDMTEKWIDPALTHVDSVAQTPQQHSTYPRERDSITEQNATLDSLHVSIPQEEPFSHSTAKYQIDPQLPIETRLANPYAASSSTDPATSSNSPQQYSSSLDQTSFQRMEPTSISGGSFLYTTQVSQSVVAETPAEPWYADQRPFSLAITGESPCCQNFDSIMDDCSTSLPIEAATSIHTGHSSPTQLLTQRSKRSIEQADGAPKSAGKTRQQNLHYTQENPGERTGVIDDDKLGPSQGNLTKSGRQNLTEAEKKDRHRKSERVRRRQLQRLQNELYQVVPALRNKPAKLRDRYDIATKFLAENLIAGNAKLRAILRDYKARETEES